MENIKWLWGLMDKKYHKWHIIALCISAITSLMLLINPTLTSTMVDKVFPTAPGAVPQFDLLIPILLAMLAIRILREGMRYFMIVCMEKSSQNVIYNLRVRLFTRLQYQDTRFFDRNRTGDLMTRMSADTDWCRHFLSYIDFQAIDSVVMFLSTSIYLFWVNWQLALALVLVTPILMLITKIYSKGVRKLFMGMRERQSEMNAAAQENIAANRVIKAFAREEHEKESFDGKSDAFRNAHLSINKRWLTFFPFIEILANAMTLITLFFGGFLLIQTNMGGESIWAPLTLGQLQIFTSLSWALSVPMRQLGNLLNDWQRFITCSNKVMELEMSRADIVDAPDAQSRGKVKGGIEFRNVSFAHDKQDVLTDVSFKVEPGQTLAIMGPTGSGKTTIIQLLSRCYEVKSGAILVDGCDVRRWKLQELRDGIGTATQDVFLFSDTVEGNIAFGDQSLTEDEVKDFAYRAAAGDFITHLSDGYDTIVGERGVGLSGGQKQRIALARALAVKPGILVMDDTTSAVDMETEQFIQQQLRQLPYDCTKVIIAQRISSVKDADQILILQDGRIAERGTHEELLRNRGYYWETYCLQNGIDATKEAM
ncbi:MAG: ABC transporter ATP-binding protein [Clostridiales bacterium]|nr:ABC transporter ATP-binding protein [Clostridiales bacterium]